MNKEIKTSFSFDNDSLIVSFAEIIVINTEEAEGVEFNDEFETDEKIYQLKIKQKGANNNTVTLVAESVINDFKKEYKKYLDYRINVVSNADTYESKRIKDTEEFFEKIESKIDVMLEKISNSAKIETDNIIEKNRIYNEKINKELEELKKLKEMLSEFIIEDVEEENAITGELLENEDKNNT